MTEEPKQTPLQTQYASRIEKNLITYKERSKGGKKNTTVELLLDEEKFNREELVKLSLLHLRILLGKDRSQGIWEFNDDLFLDIREEKKETDESTPLTGLACNIGASILADKDIEDPIKESTFQINSRRYRIGFIMLEAASNISLAKLHKGRKKRDKWMVFPKDKEKLTTAVEELHLDRLEEWKIHNYPTFDDPGNFNSFRHKFARDLVRRAETDVRKYYTNPNTDDENVQEDFYKRTNKVFKVVNKQMRVPYLINTDVLDVISRCGKDNILFLQELKDMAKELKEQELEKDEFKKAIATLNKRRKSIRQAYEMTLGIAKGIEDKEFYSYQFLDTRGRLYSSTAYLNHGGNKLAKSLFLFSEQEPIGKSGWTFLLAHAATTFGFDKAEIEDRANFAEERMPTWMSWAGNPVRNKFWQKVDDPFNFLAAIMEIRKAYVYEGVHGSRYDYPSGLPIHIDATCSQLQVVAGMTKHRPTGEMCNVSNKTERGDYYQLIADEVNKDFKYDSKHDDHVEKWIREFRKISKVILKMYNNGALKKDVKEFIGEWRDENEADIELACSQYWSHPDRIKIARATYKRTIMTWGYSCTPKTASKQLYDDNYTKKAFRGLTPQLCYYICKKIDTACNTIMEMPAKIMQLFIEMGLRAYKKDKDFTIIAPYTGFMSSQSYRSLKMRQVGITSKTDKRYQCNVIASKEGKMGYQDIKSAVSPNGIHMVDSVIMAHIVLNCDFNISVIHDSFASCPAYAAELFKQCRESFVSVMSEDILKDFLRQHKMLKYYSERKDGFTIRIPAEERLMAREPDEDEKKDLVIKSGDLDITEIINNSFAFS